MAADRQRTPDYSITTQAQRYPCGKVNVGSAAVKPLPLGGAGGALSELNLNVKLIAVVKGVREWLLIKSV